MPKLHLHSFWLGLAIMLILISQVNSSQCPVYCQECSLDRPPSMFTCSKCFTKNSTYVYYRQYLWSCQYLVGNKGIFVGLGVVIVCLHLFMLSMGFGVYSLIYEQIQIVSILLWVGVQQNDVYGLQATNFGQQTYNSFVRTFGVQFIIILFILSVFFFLVVATLRVPHNPTAVLIRRKRAIFPIRVITLSFNMLLFSSLASVVTIQSLSHFDIFELFLSVLGLILATVILVGIFFLCNFKKFKLDDPNYYVVCQKMLSVRWWVKNKLFFQIINNSIIICSFVFGFTQPTSSIIPIMVSQGIFTLYLLIFIKYTKLRYKIYLILSCLVFIGILVTINGQIATAEQSNQHQQHNSYRTAYTILVIVLCCVFGLATVTEILAQRYKIARQLRSFKNRFILCDKLEKDVELNKYDSNGHRKRVIEFQNNVIYKQDLSSIRKKLNHLQDLEFP